MSQDATRAVWGASPAGTTFAGGAIPQTPEFFERVLREPSSHEMPWLGEVIPFGRVAGQSVLEVGCGAGFDAYELCRSGAYYTGVDITSDNVERTLTHLAMFDYHPDVLLADAEQLPFGGDEFDIVFSNGVLHHTDRIDRSCSEAARVLKHGGEFWVILYHKNSVFHWVSLYLVDHLLKLGFRKQTFPERLSRIEYTTSDQLPLVNVYSRAEVCALLEGAGLQVSGVDVRKLVPEDLPALPLLGRVWRYLPQRWLDRLGQSWGWYVVARAVKP